jgi:hypothetical protein
MAKRIRLTVRQDGIPKVGDIGDLARLNRAQTLVWLRCASLKKMRTMLIEDEADMLQECDHRRLFEITVSLMSRGVLGYNQMGRRALRKALRARLHGKRL